MSGVSLVIVGNVMAGDVVLNATFGQPRQAAVTLVTFAVLATLVSGAGALIYRWYFRTEIPEGVAILLGVAIVALYLNTASLGLLVAGDDPELLTVDAVLFNVVALGVAAAVSPLGRYVGDRLAVDVFALTGFSGVNGEVGRMVRTVGRVTPITLPAAEDIADMDTYEPVSAEKKAEMAERTLLFSKRASLEEIRSQLVDRVKTDFGVGYVDVDITADGSLGYFAVGSRAIGLGPTLAPGRVAVAIAADPANSATVGDMVQVWRTDPDPKRVVTGELRGVSGDVTTVVIDESDASKISVEGGYRLVTLPAEPQADREFASLLRTADETMAVVTVGVGSDLVGSSVGDIEAVVAAVQPADGEVQAIPPRSYTFTPADTAYLVGRPDVIRRAEASAVERTVELGETVEGGPIDDGSVTAEATKSDGSGVDESDEGELDGNVRIDTDVGRDT